MKKQTCKEDWKKENAMTKREEWLCQHFRTNIINCLQSTFLHSYQLASIAFLVFTQYNNWWSLTPTGLVLPIRSEVATLSLALPLPVAPSHSLLAILRISRHSLAITRNSDSHSQVSSPIAQRAFASLHS